MRCHVCTKIERKEKVLVAKWDSIEKHVGKRKDSNGNWIMDPKCIHVKNEIYYVRLPITTILQHLNNGQTVEDKQKLVQFAIVFNLLSKGEPMTNHEDL